MRKFKPTRKSNELLRTHFPRSSKLSYFSIFSLQLFSSLLLEVAAEIKTLTSVRNPRAKGHPDSAPAPMRPSEVPHHPYCSPHSCSACPPGSSTGFCALEQRSDRESLGVSNCYSSSFFCFCFLTRRVLLYEQSKGLNQSWTALALVPVCPHALQPMSFQDQKETFL